MLLLLLECAVSHGSNPAMPTLCLRLCDHAAISQEQMCNTCRNGQEASQAAAAPAAAFSLPVQTTHWRTSRRFQRSWQRLSASRRPPQRSPSRSCGFQRHARPDPQRCLSLTVDKRHACCCRPSAPRISREPLQRPTCPHGTTNCQCCGWAALPSPPQRRRVP